MNSPKTLLARSRGFTLVEMLVALVVLSVGMLGIAGLFAVSLRSGGSAISRMQAVNLAQDIADRILSNRRAAGSYAATVTDTGTDNSCFNGSTNCTPSALAANDILLWKNAIKAAFPGSGTGAISYAGAVVPQQPSTFTITVNWKEQGQAVGESESTQSFTMQVMTPTE